MKENSKNNQLREMYDNVMLPNYAPASFVPESAKAPSYGIRITKNT